jgi:hypothetical protein
LTLLLIAAGLCAWPAEAQADGGKVKVELYVMSNCPFGVQAENGLLPAAKALDQGVDLELAFIGSETPAAAGAKDAKPQFQSMHGPGEVEEDIRQLCMRQLYPKAYMDYILERNKDVRSADWQAAVKKAGGDAAKVASCVDGAPGAALLSQSFKAAQARQAGGSPTIYIAGQSYSGGRSEKAFTKALCAAIKTPSADEAKACARAATLPDDAAGAAGGCDAAQPVAFDVWVVRESACQACELTLLDGLKTKHPAATIEKVEAQSAKGQALIAKHHARTLPLYVLDKKVEGDPSFRDLLDKFYAKSADQYIVRPGPDTYQPTVLLDRPRVPRHLDVFVEALSPFGTRAEVELAHYLARNASDDVTLSMHFITQESVTADGAAAVSAPAGKARSASLRELSQVSAGELTSRQGDDGVQESLRQACLFQHASMGTYFAYLDCLNAGMASAACLGGDAAVKQCMAGDEGRGLLREDARLVKSLGINGSIAILWENRYGPFYWHDVDWKALLDNKKD